jgi:hypothetical protein
MDADASRQRLQRGWSGEGGANLSTGQAKHWPCIEAGDAERESALCQSTAMPDGRTTAGPEEGLRPPRRPQLGANATS